MTYYLVCSQQCYCYLCCRHYAEVITFRNCVLHLKSMLSTSWAGRRLERLKNVLRNFRDADHVFGLCEYRGAVLTHEFGVTVHHLQKITGMWQRRVDLKKRYTTGFL